MKNFKIIGTHMVKGEKGIEVLQTKMVDRPQPCAECGENARRYGARTCEPCKVKYDIQKSDNVRRQKRVDQARTIKN